MLHTEVRSKVNDVSVEPEEWVNKVSKMISECLKILDKEVKGSIINTDIGPKGELALYLV
jgi:hypothetical protein